MSYPQGLREELFDTVSRPLEVAGLYRLRWEKSANEAIVRVLEYHDYCEIEDYILCVGCDYGCEWPCATVCRIARAFHIDLEG